MPISLTPEEIKRYHLRQHGPGGSLGLRQEFSSLHSLINYLDDMPGDLDELAKHPKSKLSYDYWSKPGERYSRTGGDGYGEWSGTDSWEATKDLARKGWPDARKFIGKLTRMIYGRLGKEVFKPMLTLREQGDHGFCVATMLTGDPEFVLQMTENPNQKGRGRGKIIKLVASVDACGGHRKEQMMRRGAAMVATAMALEQAGYRCEIIGTVSSPGIDPITKARIAFHNAFIVKRAQDMPNIDTLAFALCNASVLRRVWFGAWETLPPKVRQPFRMGGADGYGYGVPMESDIKGEINLPQASFGHKAWSSDAATEEWCLAMLKEQGVLIR